MANLIYESPGIMSRLEHIADRLSEAYFSEKAFEKDGRIYEKIGIRKFKSKFMDGGRFNIDRSLGRREGLMQLVQKTKSKESINLASTALLTILSAYSLSREDYASATLCASLNLIVNFYPIAAQRYNRGKALKILQNIDENI